MIHTNIHGNCMVFFLLCEVKTACYFVKLGLAKLLLVHKAKGKQHKLEGYLCELLYSTFKTSLQPY